ncbi:MAG: hypothetical protein GX267_12385 [Fibrobacter sp.]|jgi:hemerythrin-like domain-containing protein|nr:hypothetical protein [Fibrobacter sp.]
MHNDLFKQLQEEHQLVKQILLKMLKSPEGSRKDLLEELKLNLLPHMEGEEKAFYPVLSKKTEAHQPSLEALEEHHIGKIVLHEIENTDSSSDTFLAKCKVLNDLLNHHIHEEEHEIFELARNNISEQATEEIYNNYLSQRNDYKGRLAA